MEGKIMQVVTMESEAFKKLEYLIERTAYLSEIIANSEPDKIFTVAQAAEYVGVNRRWVDTNKTAIGYFKQARTIRIKKSSIDKYLDKHTIINKPRGSGTTDRA